MEPRGISVDHSAAIPHVTQVIQRIAPISLPFGHRLRERHAQFDKRGAVKSGSIDCQHLHRRFKRASYIRYPQELTGCKQRQPTLVHVI